MADVLGSLIEVVGFGYLCIGILTLFTWSLARSLWSTKPTPLHRHFERAFAAVKRSLSSSNGVAAVGVTVGLAALAGMIVNRVADELLDGSKVTSFILPFPQFKDWDADGAWVEPWLSEDQLKQRAAAHTGQELEALRRSYCQNGVTTACVPVWLRAMATPVREPTPRRCGLFHLLRPKESAAKTPPTSSDPDPSEETGNESAAKALIQLSRVMDEVGRPSGGTIRLEEMELELFRALFAASVVLALAALAGAVRRAGKEHAPKARLTLERWREAAAAEWKRVGALATIRWAARALWARRRDETHRPYRALTLLILRVLLLVLLPSFLLRLWSEQSHRLYKRRAYMTFVKLNVLPALERGELKPPDKEVKKEP